MFLAQPPQSSYPVRVLDGVIVSKVHSAIANRARSTCCAQHTCHPALRLQARTQQLIMGPLPFWRRDLPPRLVLVSDLVGCGALTSVATSGRGATALGRPPGCSRVVHVLPAPSAPIPTAHRPATLSYFTSCFSNTPACIGDTEVLCLCCHSLLPLRARPVYTQLTCAFPYDAQPANPIRTPPRCSLRYLLTCTPSLHDYTGIPVPGKDPNRARTAHGLCLTTTSALVHTRVLA